MEDRNRADSPWLYVRLTQAVCEMMKRAILTWAMCGKGARRPFMGETMLVLLKKL